MMFQLRFEMWGAGNLRRLLLGVLISVVILALSGVLRAADYPSLYGYGQTTKYCSADPCGGASNCEESFMCDDALPYRYTEKIVGFRDLYDFNDPKIFCAEDRFGIEGCAPAETKNLQLDLTTFTNYYYDYVPSFPDAFRIFIPAGTVRGNITILMPLDEDIGFAIRYGQPPAATSFSSYGAVPWDATGDANLETMAQRDVYLQNGGGATAVLSTFVKSQPMSATEAGWLYIRKLPFSGSVLHIIKVKFKVDVAAYRNWYNGVMWEANGDPTADVACTQAYGCSESDCENSGFHWYDYECHELPKCRQTNPGGCETAAECGGLTDTYWYDNGCHGEPACTAETLYDCLNPSECEGSGSFYWYDDGCHDQPKCRADNLGGCETVDECVGVVIADDSGNNHPGYWYDDGEEMCHADPACAEAYECSEVDCEAGSGFHWYQADGDEEAACHELPKCRADNLGGCESVVECSGLDIDSWWYDNACHADPACTEADLTACENQSQCDASGFYWDGYQCLVQLPCGPDSLDGCTTQSTCEANGGSWHNFSAAGAINCTEETNTSGGTTTSTSSTVNSFWSILLGRNSVNPPPPTCDPDHLQLCTSEAGCVGSGQGYWYEGSCHAEPPQQGVLDYNPMIYAAPVRFGAQTYDGSLSPGDGISLTVEVPAARILYTLIVFPNDDYYFMRNDDSQIIFLKDLVSFGDNLAGPLFEFQNICGDLPVGYDETWEVYFLTIPLLSGEFQNLEALGTYLESEESQYSFGYYSLRVNCNEEQAPVCSWDNLGQCSQTQCGAAGYYWYNNQCHASPAASSTCDPDNLGTCLTESECEASGGVWYNYSAYGAVNCTPQ